MPVIVPPFRRFDLLHGGSVQEAVEATVKKLIRG